jgi:hypothetical protein
MREPQVKMPDLVLQRADTPSFDAADFGIKIPFERILKWNQFDKMAPAQLLRQRRNNFHVGKDFGESHHLEQIPATKPLPVLSRQLCRQCLHNLHPVPRSYFLEYVLLGSFADLPVHGDQRGIDGSGRLFAGRFDPVPEVAQQGCRC